MFSAVVRVFVASMNTCVFFWIVRFVAVCVFERNYVALFLPWAPTCELCSSWVWWNGLKLDVDLSVRGGGGQHTIGELLHIFFSTQDPSTIRGVFFFLICVLKLGGYQSVFSWILFSSVWSACASF